MGKKQKDKRLGKGKSPILLGIFAVFFVSLIFVCITYLPKAIALYKDANHKINSISYDTFNKNQTTYIYDANNNVINNVYGNKNSLYLTYDNIPNYAKNAFVSIEDKDYYKHGAISIKGNLRAFYSIIKNRGKFIQGGSTITQQLARNIFLNFNKTYGRKIEEIFIAVKLEQKFTKEQILEFYINNINFANNTYGIQAASKKYFNKDCSALNLSEISFLCAIPNEPSYYNPIKNINNTLKRRNLILLEMKKDEYITEAQYNEAINYKIVLNLEKYDGDVWVESYCIDDATKILMRSTGFKFNNTFNTQKDREKYYSEYSIAYSKNANDIRKKGYKIYTSIDMIKQKKLQNSIDDELGSFNETTNGIYSLQGAAVTIDNKTGEVIAIVGGRTSPQKDYLNRAFKSFRQPGSAFKPLVVYTPAFEKGYTPDTIMNDYYIEGGPRNDSDIYMGYVPIRKAVQMSLNSVAHQIFQDISSEYGLSFVKNMEFNKIVKEDYTASAALGGLTYGVTPVEMASAYSTIARGGNFINPTCIRSIKDSSGKIIYENKMEKKRIYSDEASYLMTDILRGSLENEWGTAYNVRLSGITSAAKTGTTSEQKDGWLCGYSFYYTTVTWVGCDIPKYVENLYGGTYPGLIWKNYMQKIHEGVEDKEFNIYTEE